MPPLIIYADYQPGSREAELVNEAFKPGTKAGTKTSDTARHSETQPSTDVTYPHLSA
jgi:hypothetical protein